VVVTVSAVVFAGGCELAVPWYNLTAGDDSAVDATISADGADDGVAPADGGDAALLCSADIPWSKAFGSAREQARHPTGLRIDGSGNAIVVGSFAGTLDFGNGTGVLTANAADAGASDAGPPTRDVFVASFDATGRARWSKRFGDEQDQGAGGVALDAQGNTLVVGSFQGTIDFGDGPHVSRGGYDIFLVKLDPAGALVWSRAFGGAGDQYAVAVAIDAAGAVIVGGDANGTVDWGTGPNEISTDFSVNTRTKMLVVKLDASGKNPAWAKIYGGDTSNPSYSYAVLDALAVDGLGNLFIAGGFSAGTYSTKSAIDFGDGLITSAGSEDAALVKLDPSGKTLWSKHFGITDGFTARSQQVGALAVDGAGGVILTGGMRGKVDYGGGPLPYVSTTGSPDSFDVFVASFDRDGAHRWSKNFGDGNEQIGVDVALNAAGDLWLTGVFDGAIDFGGGSHTSYGKDIFLVKLDARGKYLGPTRGLGDPSDQEVSAVAVDSCNFPVLLGYFAGTVDFGTGPPIASAGSTDVFVAKVSP
jgi:hypothetical protein